MKLAEALQERADLNRRIEQLRSRILNNCLVQEGEKPVEDPDELIRQLDACIERLGKLITAINLANSSTLVEGRSLTELIAQRDVLSVKLSAYRDTVDSASRTAQRATRNEIKILSAVNVKDMQKKVDQMAQELRRLDNTLQENNWKTEIEDI